MKRVRPPASPLPFQTTPWASLGLWLTGHEDTLTWSSFPSSTMPPLPVPNTPGKTHLRLSVAKQEVSWGEKVWFRVSMLHWERRCIGGGGFGKWRERDWAEKTLEEFFFFEWWWWWGGCWCSLVLRGNISKVRRKSCQINFSPFQSRPGEFLSHFTSVDLGPFFLPQLVSHHVKTCILASTPKELEPPSNW